jgi:hypothetical protein
MFEFLIATGLVGVLGVCAVFLVVFILAEPGKEISFWGIRFCKRYRLFSPIVWRRTPKILPDNWVAILQAFIALDQHHVRDERIFSEALRVKGLSELRVREVCADMEKYGLVVHRLNYIHLTKRGLVLVNKLV